MDPKRPYRMLNSDKAMREKPLWLDAVIPVYVGEERRRIDMLKACANGDIYYYGKLIGNDDDIAAALIDIVNSHQNTLGTASDQAACWAVTELLRRRDAIAPPVGAPPRDSTR
jgi:hypothetical protein